MQVITGGRYSGKTTELVKIARYDPDAVIVVFCPTLKHDILKEYPILKPEQIVVWNDMDSLIKGCRGVRKNYYIDDIEICLKRIFSCVKAITATVGGVDDDSK